VQALSGGVVTGQVKVTPRKDSQRERRDLGIIGKRDERNLVGEGHALGRGAGEKKTESENG